MNEKDGSTGKNGGLMAYFTRFLNRIRNYMDWLVISRSTNIFLACDSLNFENSEGVSTVPWIYKHDEHARPSIIKHFCKLLEQTMIIYDLYIHQTAMCKQHTASFSERSYALDLDQDNLGRTFGSGTEQLLCPDSVGLTSRPSFSFMSSRCFWSFTAFSLSFSASSHVPLFPTSQSLKTFLWTPCPNQTWLDGQCPELNGGTGKSSNYGWWIFHFWWHWRVSGFMKCRS